MRRLGLFAVQRAGRRGYWYSSALPDASPPAMSTLPLVNRVAVCHSLGPLMLPIAVNVPALGLNTSTLAEDAPPAMSTVPSVNNVAVWKERAIVMLPVAVNLPAFGS